MSSEKITLKQWNFAKLQRYQHQDGAATIRLGLPTWDEPLLKGTIYDPRSLEGDFLSAYAAQFDTVELRQTFKELPTPFDVGRWRRRVEGLNENFRFCPLVPRILSHEAKLDPDHRSFGAFLYALESFEEHLGSVILELPVSFASAHGNVLRRFFQKWPWEVPLMVDFRHRSWFEQKGVLPSFLGKNIGLLITDDFGDERPMERLIHGEHFGVRFRGRAKLGQDEQRLALWVYRMNEFKALGVKNSYFFLKEEPELCLGILQKMASSIGGRVREPPGYDPDSDQLQLL